METILVVEDDTTNREIISTILRLDDYTVIEAACGTEATRPSTATCAAADRVATNSGSLPKATYRCHSVRDSHVPA